jgi:hypothetical protein
VEVRKVMLLAAGALALGAAGSAGAAGAVVASASGGYGFSGTAAGSVFDVHPFTWNVQLHEDGSVHGEFNYTQVRDGVELSARGSLTCAVFIGNRVWVGGIIEDSSRASLVGLDMWFQAQDNGDGENDSPDMSSTLGAGGPGTGQLYCDDHPEVLFPFLVEQGNLQVRSG